MARTLVTLCGTVLLLLVGVPALAGGGGHGGSLCRGFSDGDRVALVDNCFDGIGHTVEVGTTLSVRNEGLLPHTLTAVDGSLDTGILQPGEVAQVELTEPGAIPIYCTLHATSDGQGMAGLLVVTTADGEVPTSAGTDASNDASAVEAAADDAAGGDGAAAAGDGDGGVAAGTDSGTTDARGAWVPLAIVAAAVTLFLALGRALPRRRGTTPVGEGGTPTEAVT